MRQIKQFIREIIPVIVGILIALVINNWNEDRKDKKYLNQIFSSLEKELAESSDDIKRIIPLQQVLIDSIDVYLNDETVSILYILSIANGIQAPDINMNSWKAIASSRIELIDYEKLSTLSFIEDRKENLNKRIETMSDFAFVNIEETSKGKKEIFKLVIRDAMGAEKRLQATIEEFLEK